MFANASLPTLFLFNDRELKSWKGSFKQPVLDDIVDPIDQGTIISTSRKFQLNIPNQASAQQTLSTELRPQNDPEPDVNSSRMGPPLKNLLKLNPLNIPKPEEPMKYDNDYVLMVDIGLEKCVLWLFVATTEDIQLKKSLVMEDMGLRQMIEDEVRIDNIHETLSALDMWLAQALAAHDLPKDWKVKAARCVAILNSSIEKAETRLREPKTRECVAAAFRVVFAERLRPLNLIGEEVIVELMPIESEAQYELFAAQHLYGKPFSCVVSMASLGFQVAKMRSASEGEVTTAAVGSRTPEISELTREQLWSRILVPLIHSVDFGHESLFIAGFVHGIEELIKWMKTQPPDHNITRFTAILTHASKDPVPVTHLQEVFGSQEIKMYLSSTEVEQRTANGIYFLQQIIMCGKFSKRASDGNLPTVQFRNRFRKSGRDMKLHYSLGWCVKNLLNKTSD